ncbi:MAG: hypothetical protein NVS9B9_28590 [Ktedonobacteraceae bacterium]
MLSRMKKRLTYLKDQRETSFSLTADDSEQLQTVVDTTPKLQAVRA